MAQTAIGKAALVLTTDASQAKAGLGQFGTDAKKLAAEAAAKVGEGAGRGGLVGRLLGGAAGGAVGIAMAAATAVTGFVEQQAQRIKDLARVGRAADAVGVKSDQYMGLAAAFKRIGVEGDAVNTVFARLGHFTQAAANGNGAAAATLERLGLSAAELAKLPLDQQFLQISTAISKLPPGAAQASAAMDVFGRGGAQLLPVLQKGGDELQKFVEKQKALGAAIDPAGMKAVQAAAAAIPRMQAAWDGLANRVTVAVAPAFESVFKLLSEGVELVSPVFQMLGRYWAAWGEIASAVATEVVGLVKWIVGSIGDWVKETFGVGAATVSMRDIVFGVFRVLGTAASYMWDVIKAGAGIVAIAFGAVVEYGGSVITMFRRVVDLGRDLPDALKPAGFDGFADAVGRADDKVRDVGRQVKEWGKDAVGGFGQTAGNFNAWLDRVYAKQKEKVEEVKSDALKAGETVAAAMSKFDNAALSKGSSAEVSARLKFEMGGRIADQQLAEAKKQTGVLLQIAGGITGLAVPVGDALLPL